MSALAVPLPILQGERCLLRALVPEDAPALVAHADDPAVARNLFDGFPQPYTSKAATAWATHESQSGAFGWVWAITVDGALVGCIGLRQEGGWLRCNAEIGYWVGQAHWRRGLASDAVRQVRKDCASVILWCAEKATWMAGEGVQIFGGNGYINEYPLGRLWRDAKLYEIGAGTSEIRRVLIGSELFNKAR